jgi:hypothetical protein
MKKSFWAEISPCFHPEYEFLLHCQKIIWIIIFHIEDNCNIKIIYAPIRAIIIRYLRNKRLKKNNIYSLCKLIFFIFHIIHHFNGNFSKIVFHVCYRLLFLFDTINNQHFSVARVLRIHTFINGFISQIASSRVPAVIRTDTNIFIY